jgi:hypothetical protein
MAVTSNATHTQREGEGRGRERERNQERKGGRVIKRKLTEMALKKNPYTCFHYSEKQHRQLLYEIAIIVCIYLFFDFSRFFAARFPSLALVPPWPSAGCNRRDKTRGGGL